MSAIKLEAITVCVDCADYLNEVLPYNLPQVDHLVVVTASHDKETLEVCRKFGVTCRPTDLIYKDGDSFAKARGIDFGIGFLRQDSWILHFDCDIVFPQMMRRWLEWVKLDEECIYGADRVLCPSSKEWYSYKKTQDMQYDYHCRINPPPWPIGARIALHEYQGYVPIGYYQLWHGKHGRRYPLRQSTAEHTDVLHAVQWNSHHRRLLPEFFVVHLQEGEQPMGTNWKGRKSPRFGSIK